MPLIENGHINDRLVVDATLAIIEAIVRHTTEGKEFLELFPKSCPTCFVVSVFSMVYIGTDVAVELVCKIFASLLGDPEQIILDQGNVRTLSYNIRRGYIRREDPFPYIGYCRDFKEKIYQMAEKIGSMFKTPLCKKYIEMDKSTYYSRVRKFLFSEDPRLFLEWSKAHLEKKSIFAFFKSLFVKDKH